MNHFLLLHAGWIAEKDAHQKFQDHEIGYLDIQLHKHSLLIFCYSYTIVIPSACAGSHASFALSSISMSYMSTGLGAICEQRDRLHYRFILRTLLPCHLLVKL